LLAARRRRGARLASVRRRMPRGRSSGEARAARGRAARRRRWGPIARRRMGGRGPRRRRRMPTVRGGEGRWEVGRDAGVGRGRERAGVPVLPPAFGQRGPAGRRRHRRGGCESSGGGERAERGADGEAQEWGAGRRNRRETRGGWGRFEGEARAGLKKAGRNRSGYRSYQSYRPGPVPVSGG